MWTKNIEKNHYSQQKHNIALGKKLLLKKVRRSLREKLRLFNQL